MRVCEFLETTRKGPQLIGTITYDGVGLRLQSHDPAMMRRILNTPNKGGKSNENPAKWFDALPSQYSGTYLRARILDQTKANLDELYRAVSELLGKDYNEEQHPRDEKGRWTAGLPTGSAGVAGEKSAEEIQRHVEEHKKDWQNTDRSKYTIALGKEFVEDIVNAPHNQDLRNALDREREVTERLAQHEKEMQKAADATDKAWARYDERKESMTTEERLAATRAIQPLGERMDQLVAQKAKLTGEQREIQRECEEKFGRAMRAKLESEGQQWGQPVRYSYGVDRTPGTMIGERSWETLTGGAPRGADVPRTVNIDPVQYDWRSNMNAAKNTMQLEKDESSTTFVHEMGHWYEYHTPGGYEAARAFRDTRTQHDPTVSLKSMFPNSRYREDEVTRPDKFRDAYVGKVYSPKTRATEVTSMGMQYLHANMDSFRRNAPEHFYFTVGMIRAGHMGGFPFAPRR